MDIRKENGLRLEKMAKLELHNLFCQPNIVKMRWVQNITSMWGTDTCKIKNKDKALLYHLQQQGSIQHYWLNVFEKGYCKVTIHPRFLGILSIMWLISWTDFYPQFYPWLLIFLILVNMNCIWIEKKSELNVGTFYVMLPVKTNSELSH